MTATGENQIPNCIAWIEFEKPRDNKHALEICEHANRMLVRLHKDGKPERTVVWNEERQLFEFGNEMGYETWVSNGSWFNLDYMGREDTGSRVSEQIGVFNVADGICGRVELTPFNSAVPMYDGEPVYRFRNIA